MSQLPLTHDMIVRIAGDITDEKIAAILKSGGSFEDLEEAVAWATGESDVMGDERLPLRGVASQIYEILTTDEIDADERY